MHGTELRLFGVKAPLPLLYSYFQCREYDMAAVGTTFNVFNYMTRLWPSIEPFTLPTPIRNAIVLRHGRGFTNPTINAYISFPEKPIDFILGLSCFIDLTLQTNRHSSAYSYPLKYIGSFPIRQSDIQEIRIIY